MNDPTVESVMNIVDLIMWHETLEQLRDLKKVEMNMRLALCQEMFKGQDLGSEKKDIVAVVGNFRVKATYTINTSIDEEYLEDIWDELSAEEHACVNFKPVLVKSELDKLPEESKLWDALTSKPATPTLSITAL